MQDRIGPNRVGPMGLLQPLADGVKFIFKEVVIPYGANKPLYLVAPAMAAVPAMMTVAVIPFANDVVLFGKNWGPLAIANIDIGILYLLAVGSMGVYGVILAGWASNSKYSLLGGLRSSAQMISYELAMGISIIALIMMTGTLSLGEIVNQQAGGDWNFWNVVYQPLGFLIFIICAFAECNRAPFDLPECETELVGGYHTEYSSMKLGFYMFAEYINMFISSAVLSTLYFGGYNFPFMNDLGLSHNVITILGTVFLFAKIFFFIFFFMWVRWTLPRFRYDQLMNLGWRVLLPLSIVNLLGTALVLLWIDK